MPEPVLPESPDPLPLPPQQPSATVANDLLGMLSAQDLALLLDACDERHFAAGETIYRPGDIVDACYLPVGGAMCTYFVDLTDAPPVETVLVGREGAIGGVASSGMLPAFSRIQVLNAGTFLGIALIDLERIKAEAPGIAAIFDRYADCLMAQVFQSIACNAAHTIEQRAARWLLAAVDRTGSSHVVMTQEQLAGMMGIGRSYASRVLQRFKHGGLLRTRRGGLEIVDPTGLRRHACTCNERVAEHFARVLGGVYEPI